MTKRTISWLLSLMMVVSLFAGTLTGASAANSGLTIDPPSDVIHQTGSASFTVITVLDSLIDRIGSDQSFDLNDLVKSLKDEGLNVNTLTDMLSGAGFDWDSIIGSLTGSGFNQNEILDALLATLEGQSGVDWNNLIDSLTGNGFSMDQISGALLDRLEGGDINLEELIGSISGNEGTLTDLLNSLKNKGFDMDSIWDLIGGKPGGTGGGLDDLIGRVDEAIRSIDEELGGKDGEEAGLDAERSAIVAGSGGLLANLEKAKQERKDLETLAEDSREERLSILKVLEESNDGFHIAAEDLRLRGPGDFFGVRQSGDIMFRLADIYQHADVLKAAQDCVLKYGIPNDIKERIQDKNE